jgi:hypothetical protein
MATQAEIQALIDQIATGANYPATKMNPLLNGLLNFASSGQTLVYPDLVANDTTMADTTLVLEYGVNIVVTSTSTNFACRLPIPVTGKRVVVVNRSLMTISLFPSMVGGQINNYPIDTPAVIPPDGNAYDFICIENPLPGAWIWSAPAINQWDSGEIAATTTSSAFTVNIAASGPTFAAERSGSASSTGLAYNGLNQPLVFPSGTPAVLPNINWYVGVRPSIAWNAIIKIKVYTNIVYDPISGDAPAAAIFENSCTNWYAVGTTTPNLNGSAQGPGGAGSFGPNFTALQNTVVGTGTPGVTANIGDPGTAWGEITGTWSQWGLSAVGDVLINTDATYDYWFTRAISLYLKPQVVGAVKFRFFIEYM